MSVLQVRVDDDIRSKATKIANEIGIDLTTAVRMFLKQMINERGLPFKPKVNFFYSDSNQARIKQSIESLNNGDVITKNIKDIKKLVQS